MSQPDREKVLQSIRELGKTVTVADVAAHSGLSLNDAATQLNHIAAQSGGYLEVTFTGEIGYHFENLQAAAMQAGIKKGIRAGIARTRNLLNYALHLYFGLGLAFCLAFIVFLATIGATGLVLLFLRGTEFSHREQELAAERPLKERMKETWQKLERFFFDTHQVVLGPGLADKNLEERRWRKIAELIRAHKGVLISEQLAPFALDKFKFGREDAIIPVLIRFNGHPEVSDNGNIIYVFPDMEVTAHSAPRRADKYLKEKERKFFDLPPERLYPVIIMIALNFVAMNFSAFNVRFAELVPIWWASLYYASALVFIPILRCCTVVCQNALIDLRNARRRTYMRKLEHPTQGLLLKLVEATEFAVQLQNVSNQKIIYTTAKDLIEQQFDEIEQQPEQLDARAAGDCPPKAPLRST